MQADARKDRVNILNCAAFVNAAGMTECLCCEVNCNWRVEQHAGYLCMHPCAKQIAGATATRLHILGNISALPKDEKPVVLHPFCGIDKIAKNLYLCKADGECEASFLFGNRKFCKHPGVIALFDAE